MKFLLGKKKKKLDGIICNIFLHSIIKCYRIYIQRCVYNIYSLISSSHHRLSGAHQSLTFSTCGNSLNVHLSDVSFSLENFTVKKVRFTSICFSPRNRSVFQDLFKSSVSKDGQPQFFFLLLFKPDFEKENTTTNLMGCLLF